MTPASEKQRDYILALMRKIHNQWGTGLNDGEIVQKVEERWHVDFDELTAEKAHEIIESIRAFRDPTYQPRKYRPHQPKTSKPACGLCGDPNHRLATCPKNPIYKATLK